MNLGRSILIFSLLLAPAAGWAQVVWAPFEKSTAQTPPPDLGIAPAPPPAAASNTPQGNAAPAQTSTLPAPTSQTPLAFTRAPAPNKTPPRSGATRAIIVQDADPGPILDQMGRKFPNSLLLQADSRIFFNDADYQTISKALGISYQTVASSCIVTLLGMVKTDKSAYIFNGGINPQALVRYEGRITGYTMTAQAACLLPTEPQGKQKVVHELGGRYLVQLSPVSCPPPTQSVSSLTVTYRGSDANRCVYR